jgi:uncharacterized protein (DUF58 family)
MRRKKYIVKITLPGYVYIALTIVLSVGALNTANNLLYIVSSLMLSLMILSGVSSFVNLFFIHLTMTPPDEIFADTPAPFRLIVEKKRLTAFFLAFKTRFGDYKSPYIKGQLEASLWLTFPERGKIRIDTIHIDSGFPLGFFHRACLYPVDVDVIVYPKPLPTRFIPLSGSGLKSGENTFFQGELSDEVKELKPYATEDPLKWVDWKASARKGSTVVRQFYIIEGDRVIINLSNKRDNWEKRLSEAVFLIQEGSKKRLVIGMTLPNKTINPDVGAKHKRLLLESLSLA